ncbi:tyrosine-type recombinase/integrase [Acinetobacter gerneri]|uniref:Tyrosine-type recombinase/integrase n=1 Tax=Acinetobacter gerneri TaxID=202952 RepID=A0AAW8JEF6_9GAMM|nr:integrase arm-type DNA-binding domain-containing protein [Acinetobacter gerneri]MDQ9009056.1 tyrosine-type recombinase/integrase [Acinetobacter gerneri]MDQ9013160.1 tyrosine-type recombinase/integrase [Acinetobacter gerneri]MDQ9024597.1 tyrosine-type recombinase/integrase [Acinetobacter gerneri]MDQ9051832.1 tyrosine-type recombinase/integrase [Acinetobacter gerneri]MDQ9059187.1 tyrosine-type recombinase/integrase [Acinetobacter gerneri]
MLSDTKIKSLKPAEKIYRVLDSMGLCIEVRPNGRKYWRYRYQWEKKSTTLGLGEYPNVLLAEARKKRDDAKTLILSGVNPLIEKKSKENPEKITTFKSIAQEYRDEHLKNKSQHYYDQFNTSMKKDVYKIIGDKDIRAVTSADILLILKNTTKRVKRQKNYGTGEATALQNKQFIGAVIRYAIMTLRTDYDPTQAVTGVIKRPPVEHARPLTKEEKKKVRTNLENYNGTETVRNAGMILLYTMLRTIEIRRLLWEWVDFQEKTITFPKNAMKKNRIHILPMSSQVYEVLQRQHKISNNREFVFPAVYKSVGMLSASTLNRMLEYVGLNDVSAHDFRATASTSLYEKGYEEAWVERQLAHAESNKTKASYDHSKHLQQRRKMMQDWADIVDGWRDL